MSFRSWLGDAAEVARGGVAYAAYLRVREAVLGMLDDPDAPGALPSAYWDQEMAGLDYLFDASPLLVERLREHCYHATGTLPYEYRRHHDHQRGSFKRKLGQLRSIDGRGLFVPEAPLLAGFGHRLDEGLVNIDTLKFYESLIALDKAGVLIGLEEQRTHRPAVLEVGAGWGGFAYQLRSLLPRMCYVIVDLPPMLLLSGTYLLTAFPNARAAFWSRGREDEIYRDFRSYDFVFLPHFCVERLAIQDVDLFVNMVSFQEMTEAQVEAYVRAARRMKCRVLYSHNRDRSRHNTELDSVTAILRRHYTVSEVQLLDIPYTTLVASRWQRLRRRFGRAARRILSLPEGRPPFEYRHLIARWEPEHGGGRGR